MKKEKKDWSCFEAAKKHPFIERKDETPLCSVPTEQETITTLQIFLDTLNGIQYF